ARHLALVLELAVNELRLVGGDSESDPLEPARAAGDRRVDPDHFAVQVHQRAAAVARVDRGVNLDEVLIAVATEDARAMLIGLAIERADDPVSHRSDVTERRTEGHDPVALLKLGAVTPLGGDEMIGLDLDDRQIALGVG